MKKSKFLIKMFCRNCMSFYRKCLFSALVRSACCALSMHKEHSLLWYSSALILLFFVHTCTTFLGRNF